ncbi:amino acid ABC transporter permease [Shinella sumterensis]|uniref:Amino acid ABC transporter permease n=1 Tax=Shinella sumterensis TaxID=1967501 RepID=A0AA50CTN5_9HYPH|nr:amino acid ABC transporter permease [Shinella sumterensis]WLS01197.1 amino acid ABC transporter permease [Shinella sumterensis]
MVEIAYNVPALTSRPLTRRLAPFFGTPLNAVLTIALVALLVRIGWPLADWAIFEAAVLPAEPQTCQAATGACWSFLLAKYGQILFGIYPPSERWRAALVCGLILATLVVSARPSSWRPWLALAWPGMMIVVLWLMSGGFGLPYVPTSAWGGLPVTLILTVFAIGLGFPAAVLLALGRRSHMPVVRTLSILVIETIRGLPLLSLLFVASILLPLFLPDWLLPDKFVRALLALTVFAAAYLAEVIRGGLQSISAGQAEAAEALGLGYWNTQRLIILPQAIRIVIPALTNTIIVMVKNTSLVLVVGLFDLISSGKAALSDPDWPAPSTETFLFIGLIYFILAFSFARFADFLERRGKEML